MGKLAERGKPFLGELVGFNRAYPTVEDAFVRFTESDFGSNYPANVWNLSSNGPRIPCSNARCNRGGYDFEMMLGFMVEAKEESKEVEMSCNGDEGSPKGRKPGKECSMSIKGTIAVTYRKSPHDLLNAAKGA